MRSVLSERNIVVLLFVMVIVTFSFAHEDTKKREQIYQSSRSVTVQSLEKNIPTEARGEKSELVIE